METTVRERVHEAVEKAVGSDDIQRAESASTQMLLAMSATDKHVYGGTANPRTVARNRKANKRARAQRRAARR